MSRKLFTVRDLKKLLEGCPDDAVVVVPGSDHQYYPATVYVADAERTKDTRPTFYQYWDDEHMSEGGVKTKVVLAS